MHRRIESEPARQLRSIRQLRNPFRRNKRSNFNLFETGQSNGLNQFDFIGSGNLHSLVLQSVPGTDFKNFYMGWQIIKHWSTSISSE